jgi:hypothetical protein
MDVMPQHEYLHKAGKSVELLAAGARAEELVDY